MNNDFGLIGLAVMGQNLVRNVASRGFSVSVYNRTYATTRAFLDGPAGNEGVEGFEALEDFVKSLARPRKVMILVKAGGPVDAVIDQLVPILDEGDLIIDGGNSLFKVVVSCACPETSSGPAF